MFAPQARSGIVQRDQEVYDSLGRRRVVPVRTYMERKGFVLKPRFIFIDGRTGAILYSENFREEVLYNATQTSPALSSYFELMDRLIPSFLSTLSTQTIRGDARAAPVAVPSAASAGPLRRCPLRAVRRRGLSSAANSG